MKFKGLYILAGLFLLSLSSCDDAGESSEEIKGKSFEREIVIDGNPIDTLITIKDFTSAITKIEETSDWLEVTIQGTASDVFQIKIVCSKNTTTDIRSAEVFVTCDNGDKLKLTVSQSVISEFDDIHNNVTDQPALTPMR